MSRTRSSAAIIVGGVLAVSIFLAGAFITVVGVVLERRAKLATPIAVYDPAAHPKADWRGSAAPAASEEEAEEPENDKESETKLPNVARDVPIFQRHLLDGCSKTDLDRISKSIDDAINVGAPLYNDGDFAGCYSTYEAAARAIERDVGKTCKGPANALQEARQRAKKRKTSAESAWAMRDSFDGVLDVIERRGPEL